MSGTAPERAAPDPDQPPAAAPDGDEEHDDGPGPDAGPAAGPVRKSDGAFRSISEVSAELDVPQHVLRFWETKFRQVRPLKRGGRRRYYRPTDVALLRVIRDLLYRDRLQIPGVQQLLRDPGPKALIDAHARRGDGPMAPMVAPAAESAVPDGAAIDPRCLVDVLTELEDLRAMLHSALEPDGPEL